MENTINNINICKDTLEKMMQLYIGNENITICSEQVDEQYNRLEKRISDLIYLSNDFKVKFSNDLLDLICSVESESFNKGLELGTSIIKYLFSQETPTISFMNRTPKPKAEQPTEPTDPTESDKKMIKYITDNIPLITEKNKSRLQGMIEVYADPEYRYL